MTKRKTSKGAPAAKSGRSAHHIPLPGAKPGQRVRRFKFADGSTADVDPIEWEMKLTEQKEELRRAEEIEAFVRATVEADVKASVADQIRELQEQILRLKQKQGQRPTTATKPSDIDIVLRLGELWIGQKITIAGKKRARAALVKELAAHHEVEERTARIWIDAALGISRK